MKDFEPNQSYNVRVQSASAVESQSMTPGIQLGFEKEDGAILQHTLWVTPKTTEYVARDLETLGVPQDKLASPTFMDNLGASLVGKECNITTHSEEYPKNSGKFKTKVGFINPKRDTSGAPPAHRIAEMFGGPKAYAPQKAEAAPIDDMSF